MKVVVHLFGPQAQLVGETRVTVHLPDDAPTCGALRTALAREAPSLASSLATSRFAVNHEFADDDQRVADGDEVALIGMVSGG